MGIWVASVFKVASADHFCITSAACSCNLACIFPLLPMVCDGSYLSFFVAVSLLVDMVLELCTMPTFDCYWQCILTIAWLPLYDFGFQFSGFFFLLSCPPPHPLFFFLFTGIAFIFSLKPKIAVCHLCVLFVLLVRLNGLVNRHMWPLEFFYDCLYHCIFVIVLWECFVVYNGCLIYTLSDCNQLFRCVHCELRCIGKISAASLKRIEKWSVAYFASAFGRNSRRQEHAVRAFHWCLKEMLNWICQTCIGWFIV